MTGSRARPLLVAIVAFVAVEAIAALTVIRGVSFLGYDLAAYVVGAQRALDGVPIYDPSIVQAGAFGSYLYPPQFALAIIPFALLPEQFALWQWTALAIGSIVAGVAILPVRPTVRLAILALAVISWPVIYAVLLGQVGPLLFLIFAVGWRWRDRPGPLGIALAAGTAIKIQPIILLAWAAATGRWRAVGIAVGLLLAGALVATIALGPTVWTDYAGLLTRISAAVTTTHNFSPGGLAFLAGAPRPVADAIQLLTIPVVVLIVVVAVLRASAEVSYLTAVVATQLLSPIIWDHYALILLLPTAWLLERRQWWAVAIPLLTSIPAIVFMPVGIYAVVFGVALVAPMLVERRMARSPAGTALSPRPA